MDRAVFYQNSPWKRRSTWVVAGALVGISGVIMMSAGKSEEVAMVGQVIMVGGLVAVLAATSKWPLR